ncbi:MAG: hypothetical protein AB1599_08510 [Planctomycetota bacterium]
MMTKMKPDKKWVLFLLLSILYAGVFACNDTEPKILDQLREQKLQNTDEWKTFNELWIKCSNYYNEILTKSLKPIQDQYAESLRECLSKVNGLASLKKDGLITDVEIRVMREYFSQMLIIISRPQVGAQSGSEAAKKMFAAGEEEEYQYHKKVLPLLETLSQQSNCISWVRENFVGFIKTFYSGGTQGPPKYLEYWKKPVNVEEVISLQKRVAKAIETIEKTK